MIAVLQRLEKMQGDLHFIGAPVQNRHTVFVDSADAARNFNAAEYFDTEEELLSRSFNRPRKEQLDGGTFASLHPLHKERCSRKF